MAKKIQVQYEALEQLAAQVNRQAEQARAASGRVRSQVEVLAKSWVGEGARAFQAEMGDLVLPGLERAANSLEEIGRALGMLVQLFREAEEEAASLFPGGGGVAAGAGAGTAAGGQIEDLLARDPRGLFQDDYMRRLIGSRFRGVGGELRSAMNELMKNPTGARREEILPRIAELRGRPVDEIRAEYDKFLEVRAHREATHPKAPEEISSFHPWFMGSNTQLRYGKVVGDAFGIDPVFGAMLNPTGGLVGPDNWSISGDDTAVGYHGVVHDAAGYLYNYHGVGPGYDYLGRENRDTSSPLSGQREGIAHWRELVGGLDPISAKSEEVMRDFVGVVDFGSWIFKQAKGIF